MMKNILLVFFTIYSITISSQNLKKNAIESDNYNIKWTPELAEKSTYNDQTVLSYTTDERDIYSIRIDDDFGHAEIVRLDSNFIKKCSFDLDNDYNFGDKKFKIIGSTIVKGRPNLLVYSLDNDNNVTIGALPINTNCNVNNNGIYAKPFSARDEGVKKLALYDVKMEASKKPSLYAVKSNNNKYTLILTRTGNLRQENQKIILSVFDNNFDLVYQIDKFVNMKYTELNFESTIITNEGEVFSLLLQNVGGKLHSNKVEEKRYLLKGSKEGIIVSDEVKFGNAIIRRSKLFNERGNQIYFSSLVVEETNHKAKLSEIYLAKVDNVLGKIGMPSKLKINEDFLSKFGIDKKTDLKYYVIRNMDFTEKGNFFLTLEQFQSSETRAYSNTHNFKSQFIESNITDRGDKVWEIKFYSNILVLNYNSNLDFSWCKLVEKGQGFRSSSMVNYGGFKSIAINDNLGLLYNDFYGNYDEKMKKIESVNSLTNSVLVVREVSESAVNSKIIYDGRKEKCILKVPSFSKVDDSRLLICGNAIVAFGKTTKTSKYGLLTVKNNSLTFLTTKTDNSSVKNEDKKEMPNEKSSDPTAIELISTNVPVASNEKLPKADASGSIATENEELSFSANKGKPVKQMDLKNLTKEPTVSKKDQDSAGAKANRPTNVEPTPAAEKVDTPPRVVVIPNPQYSNVNAAYKAELAKRNAEFEAANAKAAQIADKVDYYKKLRIKFDQEAEEKRIKDSMAAVEKAKDDAKAYDARHLKPEEAPQFEKHRSGYVEPPIQKKTAEEEYNELFKGE